MEELNIEIREWEHRCADGCCFEYGEEIYLNGKQLGRSNSGEDVEQSLKLVLEDLGYKVNIERN